MNQGQTLLSNITEQKNLVLFNQIVARLQALYNLQLQSHFITDSPIYITQDGIRFLYIRHNSNVPELASSTIKIPWYITLNINMSTSSLLQYNIASADPDKTWNSQIGRWL